MCALVLGALVWRGIRLKSRKEWLVWRYQAEQYRLLKFRFLIQPELWSAPPPSAGDPAGFLGELEEIQKLDYGAIEERARINVPQSWR